MDNLDQYDASGPSPGIWRSATADKLALLVDAKAYFGAFKSAALQARRSIFMVGWDFHSQTPLSGQTDGDVPNALGPFLNHLVRRNRRLIVRILCWDSPLIYAGDREWMARARFGWLTDRRLRFVTDAAHPVGGSQHQKIVVIDDDLAFTGGLDFTFGRFDDPSHLPDAAWRTNPDGSSYEPFHDMQVAVTGDAARALGDVARERWQRATGKNLRAATSPERIWPDHLRPDLLATTVGLSRTLPAWRDYPAVREIEAWFTHAIERAERYVYIENQYFSAEVIAHIIGNRLEQEQGPDFVVVLPDEPIGWLERVAMGIRQSAVLNALKARDHHNRLQLLMPVVGEAGQTPVKVHAKLILVDDRWAAIGSANLNNRSMGFDSECNLVIEGQPDSPESDAVRGYLTRLLAEHLDCDAGKVDRTLEETGSLIATIDRLCGTGRRLAPLPLAQPGVVDRAVAESELFDPDRTAEPERMADALTEDPNRRLSMRRSLTLLMGFIAVIATFAAFWQWGPLAELTQTNALIATIDRWLSGWSGMTLMIGIFVLGGITAFPVVVLIAASGMLYGPMLGIAVAMTGALASAAAGYSIGRLAGRDMLSRLFAGKLDWLDRQFAKRGILAMAVLRVVPVAPYTVVNIAAGASRLRFRDYMVGTALGMSPGIVAMTSLAGQIVAAVNSPDAENLAILAALVAIAGTVIFWAWRRFAHD